jgi:hypothetical protein
MGKVKTRFNSQRKLVEDPKLGIIWGSWIAGRPHISTPGLPDIPSCNEAVIGAHIRLLVVFGISPLVTGTREYLTASDSLARDKRILLADT